MATKRIAADGSDSVMLELSGAEYLTIRRALAKALVRAREIGASADEEANLWLLSHLEPDAWSVPLD